MPNIARRITTEWRRFDDLSAIALYELLRFRQRIFVVEQASPYPDLDGLDQPAWHLLLHAEDMLAGCLRLLPPSDLTLPVRIGRVAVAVELRRQRLGHRIMMEALSLCRERYSGCPIGLSAQTSLANFYRSFGFVETGAPYDDFGVRHIDMVMPPQPHGARGDGPRGTRP